MEETPEQVLARLARYRDSLQRPPSSTITGSPPVSSAAARSSIALAQRSIRDARSSLEAARRPDEPAAPSAVLGGEVRVVEPSRSWQLTRGGQGVWAGQSAVLATLLGQVLAAVACVIALLAYMHLGPNTAIAIVGVLAIAGAVAAWRRVPLALWWMLGLVLGAAVGRWS